MSTANDLKKRLLGDPSAVSRELACNTECQATRNRIHDLGSELCTLLGDRNALEIANKRHSRSIGVAKRQGEDCSELLAATRGNSKKIAQIDLLITCAMDRLAVLADVGPVPRSATLAGGTSVDAPMRFDLQTELGESASAASHVVDQTDAASWDAYVNAHPHSTPYHASGWKALIGRNFGHEGYYLSARDTDDQVVGILPLIHLRSRSFGSFLVSMPYVNYGGPLANSRTVAGQLMERGARLAGELGCSHAEIRECHPRQGWTARTHKVAMIRALPETSEMLDRQLGSRVRAQVKRSLDANPTVAFGGEELLRSFYAVLSRNMRDLGSPVHGVEFFRDMLATFPDTFLAVVTIRGRPVAAAFLFGYRDTLEIPWASSLRSVNPLGANMFMYRSVLDEAQNRGYKFFDFGRSTENSATFRFKKQWGAKPRQLHWHYWLADGVSAPRLDPGNPKYRLAIRCWQHLPVRSTTLLGPWIVRNLP